MSRVALSVQDQSLASRFYTICETLKQEKYHNRMSKPLAFWVLPNDRRLPLALMNRSIGQIINTPFDDLAATPGIGRKKISSLVSLMVRATSDEPPAVPSSPGSGTSEEGGVTPFDAKIVSEALWSQWTAVVRQYNLGNECIGRIADSLNSMPTVIWTRKLGEYENLTLSQIRGLRTHGEKRVRCVMQVMHKAYSIAGSGRREPDEVLRRKLGSQRILAVANWVTNQIRSVNSPTSEEVSIHLANPILEQIAVDCGETVHTVAKQRLGMNEQPMSVREQAQTMGVTRARIYQLLEDCHKVIDVRWPRGGSQLDQLTAKLGSQLGQEGIDDPSLFLAVRQLCFPDRSQERQDARHDEKPSPHFLRY